MSYRKFTKDIWIIGLTNVIIALRGLILLPIITKILGESNYGIWVQIIAILPLIALLTTLGLPYTLVRFLAGEKNPKELQDGFFSTLTITLGTTVTLSCLLLFFAANIGGFLHWPESVVKILAFITFFECVNFLFLHVFRASQKIPLYSFFILLQTLGEIIFTVAAVLMGHGLYGAIMALLLVRVINFFISGGIVLGRMGLAIPRFTKTKEYLKFGLPTIPANLSNWSTGSADQYVISHFLGLSSVAYYESATPLASIMSFIGAPFSFLLPAAVSKLHSEQKMDDVKKYLQYSLKYFLALGIPALFGLSVLAKKILTFLATPAIAQHSYLLVPLVTFGMLCYGVYGIIYLILILEKKTMLVGKIWVAGALANFGLNFFLVPRLGIMAAAFISLFTYLGILLATHHSAFKYITFDIDWAFIQKSALASLLMALAIFFINPNGLVGLALTIIGGAVIYFALLLIFKSFSQNEFNFFKSLLKKEIRP